MVTSTVYCPMRRVERTGLKPGRSTVSSNRGAAKRPWRVKQPAVLVAVGLESHDIDTCAPPSGYPREVCTLPAT